MAIVDTIRFTVKKQEYSIDYLSDNLLNTLLEIRNLIGINWFEQAKSKKQAQKMPVLIEREYLKGIIIKSWDKKFYTLGSNFAFWSGLTNNKDNYQIGFRIGLTSENESLINNIYISFPYSNNSITIDSEIVQQLKKIISNIWEVIGSELIYR